MLVDQEHKKAYLYNTEDYRDIVCDIPTYSGLSASRGINGFVEKTTPTEIPFDITSAAGMVGILTEVSKPPTFMKVDINVHNVFGWARYYYDKAKKNKQKPEKKNMFEELRSPSKTLVDYVNPWKGNEGDFALIMDLLNDPKTQKKLGAFYTPEPYCELAHRLLQEAIARVPEGQDYVIIDRCAGTGNMESVLTDEELSHAIINTYELKEWYVLKDRIGNRARYLIPPIPSDPSKLPPTTPDDNNLLLGANALTEEFCNNLESVIEDTKKTDEISIIFYENPPYLQATNIEFQKSGDGKDMSYTSDYLVRELAKENSKAAEEMANAFIWSAFNRFMKADTDSYVLLAPPKYWKTQHLVNKKFLGGYGMNRKHFHANTAGCIMCALWSNEDDEKTNEISITAYDIDNTGKTKLDSVITTQKVFTSFSDVYYDNSNKYAGDIKQGIVVGTNGYERDGSFKPTTNDDIIGYMVCHAYGFDNPDAKSSLLSAGRYDGHGFYLRENEWIDKLPLFAATRYVRYNRNWTQKSLIMKSGDGSEQYFDDINNNDDPENILVKCLIFAGLELQNHMLCFTGSDGREYKNEICFGSKETLASKALQEFVDDGYELSEAEKSLFDDWKAILSRVKEQYDDGSYRYPYDAAARQGYNPDYTYGLYQIDKEVNYQIPSGQFKPNGEPKMTVADGDLNNMLIAFKQKVGQYYLDEIVPLLFKYEFLK